MFQKDRYLFPVESSKARTGRDVPRPSRTRKEKENKKPSNVRRTALFAAVVILASVGLVVSRFWSTPFDEKKKSTKTDVAKAKSTVDLENSVAPPTGVSEDQSPPRFLYPASERALELARHPLSAPVKEKLPLTAEPWGEDDPAREGWTSEVFAAAAQSQLAALGRWLARTDDLDGDRAAELAASDFSGDRLRPAQPREDYASPLLVIRRGDDVSFPPGGPFVDKIERRFKGSAGLADALKDLVAPYRGHADVKATTEIVSVTPVQDAWDAAILFRSTGPTPTGRFQQTARWRSRWSQATPGGLPRLQGLVLERYEESTTPRRSNPLFVDCTEAVLARNPSFKEQIALGKGYWSSRLQNIYGNSFVGPSSVAIGDANRDGLDDLFLCQSGGLPNRLFIQEPDGAARDITVESGLDHLDVTVAALFIDVDNDMDQDLVIATASGISTFQNDGSAVFTLKSTIPCESLPRSLCAADFDQDGDLDVFVLTHGIERSTREQPTLQPSPWPVAANGGKPMLLRNDGNGEWTDAASDVGLATSMWGTSAAWEDADNDGDQDLAIASEFGPTRLFRNNSGQFALVMRSAALDTPLVAGGLAWSDLNNDGLMDLMVAGRYSAAGLRIVEQRLFRAELEEAERDAFKLLAGGGRIYLNRGGMQFEEAPGQGGVASTGWTLGVVPVDVNNDGFDELFVTNGWVTNDDPRDLSSFFWRRVASKAPLANKPETMAEYNSALGQLNTRLLAGNSLGGGEAKRLFFNPLFPPMADVSALSGLGISDDGGTPVVSDWDQDGDLDLWTTQRVGPQLRFHRNEAGGNHYLLLSLGAKKGNRDAIGARIEVTCPAAAGANPLVLRRTLRAGDGAGQSSKWVHVGLGSHANVKLTIKWPSGFKQEVESIKADQRYRVMEGDVPEPWESTRVVQLAPSTSLAEPATNADVRLILGARLPMPIVDHQSLGGQPQAGEDHRFGPMLVVFWSARGQNSLDQLVELATREQDLKDAKLKVLALNVDAGSPPGARLKSLLEPMHFSFATGIADPDLLKKIDLFDGHLLDGHRPWTLPTSFLVDEKGRVAMIYKGIVKTLTLMSDLGLLAADDARHRDMGTPFKGKWIAKAIPTGLLSLADDYWTRGYRADAELCVKAEVISLQRQGKEETKAAVQAIVDDWSRRFPALAEETLTIH